MASNAKTLARKEKGVKKSAAWWAKFHRDIHKVVSTGDLPSHYVGGGQSFTRGKKTA